MISGVIYLDNAATSFPKPQSIAQEMAKCIDNYCGNSGRGSHKLSLLAANKIYDCRELISKLVGVDLPENIVFTPSCTYGLNLIIKGYLQAGDHVLISDMEHNAVLRPLYKLKKEGGITYDVFPALLNAEISDEKLLLEIERRIRKNTRLIICNHQSNICSYSLPLKKIGALCKREGIELVVDAAQSVGHLDIDMRDMNVAFLSAAGHKGLYGPQGSAFIAVNSKRILETLIEGGVGIHSLDNDMPFDLPERYEAGTMPLPSIVGLQEGLKFVEYYTLEGIRAHEQMLFRYARERLLNMNEVKVYLPEFEGSTILFNIDGASAEQIGEFLDRGSICVRAGFHCSALAHRSLGTAEAGGVRVSFGAFNGKRDIDRLIDAINTFNRNQ